MPCQATGYLDEYLTLSHFLFIPIFVDSVLIEKHNLYGIISINQCSRLNDVSKILQIRYSERKILKMFVSYNKIRSALRNHFHVVWQSWQ